jgi:UDP-glucose 4,6-dehydratase
MTHQPRNVLITGGAGFIASHVAILFAEKYPDYKVSFSDTNQVVAFLFDGTN